ncbi:adenine deaminase C-terminal domain-containing protein [Alkalicoccus chagannorensis]|uniref:adenine deaminase C-terminal domain-containing protein n=1 Tax=Alkalicoccus chagannorensis TaxID=427072 RepID=UPI00042009CC|nr:adenine deaminase C-terminal domain-containing protein [Alkalicoccus chagannorensis]
MIKGFSHYWTKKQIKTHLSVVKGKTPPTLVIKDVTYLNSMRRQWVTANIWIYEDRIVYIGSDMPESADSVMDAEGKFAVPGYIEHHAHPFQLYNPMTLAAFSAVRGTTTMVGDNLPFFLHLQKDKAFALLDKMQETPMTMLWSARYDSQTELQQENEVFSYANIRSWLDHPYVVQGGELTDWSKVLNGSDDQLLHSMTETKDLRKPIEGHLPGAGKKTLTQMALLGVDGDHEAMTGEDVMARLDSGITASLRSSSIRDDLPDLLDELHELGLNNYDSLMMTTDGSPPHFTKHGMMERLIQTATDHGVPFIDAVHMVTKNVARHFFMDDVLGIIAPGRIASINFLSSKDDPRPVDVLAKGRWVRRDDEPCFPEIDINWSDFGLGPLELDWDLGEKDLHFSMPLGMEMENDVIMKPYQILKDPTGDRLPEDCDEHFMVLIDREGRWNVSTLVKGFAGNIYGFASSFSSAGDILLIGKDKEGIRKAFQRLKEKKGGILLLDEDGTETAVDLPIAGMFSALGMEEGLIDQEAAFREAMQARGYAFGDPVYTLLFFSATHLPYVRITQKGIIDVKKKRVLFPALMR